MTLLMSFEEIKALTGGYTQPARQLEVLRDQGYWRARRSRLTGEVILERAHYEAVCAGLDQPQPARRQERAPQLRPL